MSDLVTRAEVIKLARTLDVAGVQCRPLESLGAEDLRRLRQHMSAVLFNGDRQRFRRLAEIVRIVPPAVAATIAERAFGPLITARVAGLVPVPKAVEIIKYVGVMFLADAVVELDPRTAPDLIRAAPTQTEVDVGLEVLERGDHVTVGRFVDFVTDETIRAIVDRIRDDEQLLRVAFYVEVPEQLDRLFSLLPQDRKRGIARSAVAGSTELRLASLSLLSRVSDTLRTELGDLAAEAPEPTLDDFVMTAVKEGATAELLTAISGMGPASQDKVARLPAFSDDAVLEALARAAADTGQQTELKAFAERMDRDSQRRLAQMA